MAAYDNSPFITKGAEKPATQGFVGENAGGQGSMGRTNDGENYRQRYDPKGTFGSPVKDGLTPSAAQGLIAKSTGIQVGSKQNPDLYGKSGKF